MHDSVVIPSLIISLLTATAAAESADPRFKPVGEGWFAFDTGVVKGRLQCDGKSQGMPSFVDVKTGTELAYGGGNPGIMSFYRLFSAGKRWGDMQKGDTFRGWPQTSQLLSDGGVSIHWPAAEDHPVEVTATFRWVDPSTLDVETVVKPKVAMPAFEIFISSYFSNSFQNFVYVQPPRFAPGKPHFLAPHGDPMVIGTYMAYPRDLRAAQMIYDGRWEQGHSPVQWSVTRFIAAPLALMRDGKSDITVVQMTRPQDCFAVEMPYNLTPPDGVAGHRSIYFSLFGGDLKAGESARALTRTIVGRDITDEKALEAYATFVGQTKGN